MQRVLERTVCRGAVDTVKNRQWVYFLGPPRGARAREGEKGTSGHRRTTSATYKERTGMKRSSLAGEEIRRQKVARVRDYLPAFAENVNKGEGGLQTNKR